MHVLQIDQLPTYITDVCAKLVYHFEETYKVEGLILFLIVL